MSKSSGVFVHMYVVFIVRALKRPVRMKNLVRWRVDSLLEIGLRISGSSIRRESIGLPSGGEWARGSSFSWSIGIVAGEGRVGAAFLRVWGMR